MKGRYALDAGLVAEVTDSIRELDKASWTQGAGRNFFLGYEFLETFERTAPEHMSFRYVLLRDGSRVAGILYFQLIHLSATEMGFILKPILQVTPMAGQWTEWLKKTREQKGFRILISGNNFISGEHGVGLAKNADPEQVFAALAETAKRIARHDKNPAKISAILVKDYFTKFPDIPSDVLRKKRFHRFKVEPEMIVPVMWDTFSGYKAAMSKKYRNRMKIVYRNSEMLEVREMNANDIAEASLEIYGLYLQVHMRAKFRLAALGKN